MISPPQELPISLRISVTDRCQLRCLYCMPPDGVPKRSREDILSFEEIVHFIRVLKPLYGLSKVHITGGEPTIRPNLADLIERLAREEISDIALTTNGQLLCETAMPLKNAGLKRVNISLDSLTPKTYARLTRGGDLQRTLDGLEAALSSGLSPIKLNTIVIRGFNSDEVVSIARFALDRGCEVRFLELMPIGPAAEHFDQWFVSSAQVSAKVSEAFDLCAEPARPGNSSRRFVAKDGQGREGVIGFISSITEPFCAGCRRLRLTASGQLVGCLGIGEGVDIRPLLRGTQPAAASRLVEAVQEALRLKRNGQAFITRNLMAVTGG